jgi:hypothetical protein
LREVLETITLLKRRRENGLPLPLIDDDMHNLGGFERGRLQAAVEAYEEPVDLLLTYFRCSTPFRPNLSGWYFMWLIQFGSYAFITV